MGHEMLHRCKHPARIRPKGSAGKHPSSKGRRGHHSHLSGSTSHAEDAAESDGIHRHDE